MDVKSALPGDMILRTVSNPAQQVVIYSSYFNCFIFFKDFFIFLFFWKLGGSVAATTHSPVSSCCCFATVSLSQSPA